MMKKTKQDFKPELFCPIKQTLKLLGKRWTMLLIKELYYSPKSRLGFMDLRRLLPDISTKVLSQRLKEMAADGLLKRRVNARAKPVRVNYSLTDKGNDSCDIIDDLKKYGLKWGGRDTLDCSDIDCELCARERSEAISAALP